MRDRLAGMKPPTLVINGAHDVSLQRGGETASMIPGAKHVVLPGTGHACCIEDPAAFDAGGAGVPEGEGAVAEVACRGGTRRRNLASSPAERMAQRREP